MDSSPPIRRWRMNFLVLTAILFSTAWTSSAQSQQPVPAEILETLGRLSSGPGTTTLFAAYCVGPTSLIGVFPTRELALDALAAGRGSCSTLEIQGATREGDDPVPVSRLRRLAEAVDGYRTGEPLWVVSRDEFPHHVIGVFGSLEEAQGNLQSGTSVHGPYSAPRDRSLINSLTLIGHRPDSECPFRDPECPDPLRWIFNADSTYRFVAVDSTRLTLFLDGGARSEAITFPYPIDALFLTPAAIEKFYVPYLTEVYGVETAATFWDELMNQLSGMRIIP